MAYSQRAKRERLEQARSGLMSKRNGDKSECVLSELIVVFGLADAYVVTDDGL